MVNYGLPDFNSESNFLTNLITPHSENPATVVTSIGSAHVLLTLKAHVGVWNRIFWVISEDTDTGDQTNPDYATYDKTMLSIKIPAFDESDTAIDTTTYPLATGGVLQVAAPSPFHRAEETIVFRDAAFVFDGIDLKGGSSTPDDGGVGFTGVAGLIPFRRQIVALAADNSEADTYSNLITDIRARISEVTTKVGAKLETLLQGIAGAADTGDNKDGMKNAIMGENEATLEAHAYAGSFIEDLVKQSQHNGADGALDHMNDKLGLPKTAGVGVPQTGQSTGIFVARTDITNMQTSQAFALQFVAGDTFEFNYSVKHKDGEGPNNNTVFRIRIVLVANEASILPNEKALNVDVTDAITGY
tara:strand:- start:15 stop:1091 length:1077 start_codon:yes stop_codon:yes gene_type:complete